MFLDLKDIQKKSRMPTLIWVCVLWSAMWTFVNLLGHFSFSCKTLQRLASFRDENSTVVAYSCLFLSSLSARLITSHHIIPCWSVGPALENYWWEQSHERRLLTSLMCCSWYTTPHSSTGLTAVRYDDGVDRRGWGNLAVINLLGRFWGICCSAR